MLSGYSADMEVCSQDMGSIGWYAVLPAVTAGRRSRKGPRLGAWRPRNGDRRHPSWKFHLDRTSLLATTVYSLSISLSSHSLTVGTHQSSRLLIS